MLSTLAAYLCYKKVACRLGLVFAIIATVQGYIYLAMPGMIIR